MSSQATLLVDGHIHIYPHYDLEYAINNGICNLQNWAKTTSTDKVIPIWLLAERYDCNFFDQAVNFNINGLKFMPCAEKETLVVEREGEPVLYILAGRQIVTREGLEIIALTTTLFLNDREKSTTEVINRVIDSGGLAAINWAPGKWFFSRGKVVEQLLLLYSPESLLIGDTSLRTTIWPLPKLMLKAKNKGFKIIAGSDPLPFKDEEKQIGLYGFKVLGEFNDECPAFSLRTLLKSRQIPVHLIGKRNNPFIFSKRQLKILTLSRGSIL